MPAVPGRDRHRHGQTFTVEVLKTARSPTGIRRRCLLAEPADRECPLTRTLHTWLTNPASERFDASESPHCVECLPSHGHIVADGHELLDGFYASDSASPAFGSAERASLLASTCSSDCPGLGLLTKKKTRRNAVWPGIAINARGVRWASGASSSGCRSLYLVMLRHVDSHRVRVSGWLIALASTPIIAGVVIDLSSAPAGLWMSAFSSRGGWQPHRAGAPRNTRVAQV